MNLYQNSNPTSTKNLYTGSPITDLIIQTMASSGSSSVRAKAKRPPSARRLQPEPGCLGDTGAATGYTLCRGSDRVAGTGPGAAPGLPPSCSTVTSL